MAEMELRAMEPADWPAVAELICVSTNFWYETHGMSRPFKRGPDGTKLFCEVYEALDPGCGIIAVNRDTGRMMGSCFYRERETHVSLGIMNAHPNYFGAGVARELLEFIIDFAERQQKPLRLVASAMNLDSFSLYTKAGFVPRRAFQDMFIDVPEAGMSLTVPGAECVREATLGDVDAMAAVEMAVSHISRRKDYRHFIENEAGIWHTSVYENEDGGIDGFLVSVAHSGSNMIGPGVARTEEQTVALVLAELNQNKGRTPLFLVPVDCPQLRDTMYAWGARNCEIHFAHVRGEFQPFNGVAMPTFMPETG